VTGLARLAGGAAGGMLLATGLPALFRRRVARRGRLALLLHGVSSRRLEEFDPGIQPRLTADDLAYLLDWLGSRFSFLTPQEFLMGDRPGVLLTFDDGFANNAVQALPVLRSFECPALLFVSTQHVINPRDWLDFVRERASRVWRSPSDVPEDLCADWFDGMSEQQLRECAASPLITIGCHGVGHRVLTACSGRELIYELRESKSYLEGVIGRAVEYFAYPKGLYDARVMRETGMAGYAAAFAIDPVGLGSPDLEVPRVGIYAVDRRYLSLKLSGLHRPALPVVPGPRRGRGRAFDTGCDGSREVSSAPEAGDPPDGTHDHAEI